MHVKYKNFTNKKMFEGQEQNNFNEVFEMWKITLIQHLCVGRLSESSRG